MRISSPSCIILAQNWHTNNFGILYTNNQPSNRKGGTMFKRILVGLKFTPASRSALKKGIELAREHGAELHIFHALDFRLQDLDVSDPRRAEINQETQHWYETEVKPLLNGSNNTTFGCQPADPAMGVCKLARHNNYDLIILGSH